MQSVHADLLVEQRRPTPPKPLFRLTVRDLHLRWSVLHNAGASNVDQTDAAYNDSADEIVRCRIYGTNLTTQIITDPDTEAQWESWTARTGAIELSDCAISADGETVRVFFERDVTGTKSLYEYKSTDGGSSWASQVLVDSQVSASNYQAFSSAHPDCVVFCRPDGTVHLRRYTAGAWAAAEAWAGTPSACTGIGTWGDHAADLWVYISGTFSGSHNLHLASYSTGEGWKDDGTIMPQGTVQANFVTRWPTLHLKVAANYEGFGTWIEDINAGGLDSAIQTVVPCYANLTLMGPRVTPNVPVDQTTPVRTRIIYDSTNGYYYLCSHLTIYRAREWTSTVTSKNFQTTDIANALYIDSGNGATLDVDLHDLDHSLAAFGSGATAINAIRPNAHLVLERGYRTTSGIKYVGLPVHFLTSAGYEHSRNGEVFRIRAEDGLNLARRILSSHQQQRLTSAINLLAQDFVKLMSPCGLSYDGTNGKWALSIPDFTIPPGQDLLTTMHRLLATIGSRLWWHALQSYPFGEWVATLLYDTPGSSVATYEYRTSNTARQPFHLAYLPTTAAGANQIRSHGEAVGINLSNAALSERDGLDMYHFHTTRHLDTTAELTDAAEGIYERGQAKQHSGHITARPHLGIEIGDVISIYHAGWSLSNVSRRVAGIREVFQHHRNRYEQTLLLENDT